MSVGQRRYGAITVRPQDIDINQKNAPGQPLLHVLIHDNHFRILRLLLKQEAKLDINARDQSGRTALMYASERNRNEMVYSCLASGVLMLTQSIRMDGRRSGGLLQRAIARSQSCYAIMSTWEPNGICCFQEEREKLGTVPPEAPINFTRSNTDYVILIIDPS